jgi:hypothetical protein
MVPDRGMWCGLQSEKYKVSSVINRMEVCPLTVTEGRIVNVSNIDRSRLKQIKGLLELSLKVIDEVIKVDQIEPILKAAQTAETGSHCHSGVDGFTGGVVENDLTTVEEHQAELPPFQEKQVVEAPVQGAYLLTRDKPGQLNI